MRLPKNLPAAQAMPVHAMRRLAARGMASCMLVFCLNLATAVHASTSTSAAAQASGCTAGWDQLLPREQRERESLARGCALSEPPSADALTAGQLSVYNRPLTHGPVGPLAAPGAAAPAPARTAAVPAVPRTAPAVRSAGISRPVALAPLIDQAARSHDIDPLLLHAIARVESRHRTGAVSHAGAHGLMQVIVPTASRFGVGNARALHDPQTNLHVSARYLKTLQQRFGNDLRLVLAAYNAGEGAVEKHGRRIPPYRETQGYVRSVLAEYALLRRVSQRPAATPAAESVLAGLEAGL